MSASNCTGEDRLIDFVDGEVAGDEAASIARHLEECPVCRASVESLRLVLDAAGSDKVPEPEPAYWAYFAQNVAGRVKSRAESRRRRFRLVLIPGLATVAVSVFLVVMFTRGPVGPVGDVESIIAEINAYVVTEEVLLESGVDALVLGEIGTDAGLVNEYLTETGELDEVVGELDEDEERALINKLNNLMELRGSIDSDARKEC
jgi:hypothetical protein